MKRRMSPLSKTLVRSIFSDSTNNTFQVDEQKAMALARRLPAWLSRQNHHSFNLLLTGGERSGYPAPHNYLFVLGCSQHHAVFHDGLVGLDTFCANDFVFGTISYDLKNSFKNLSSENENTFDFPLTDFRKHEMVVTCDFDGKIEVYRNVSKLSIEDVLNDIWNSPVLEQTVTEPPPLLFEKDVTDQEYLKNVDSIRRLIKEGEVYEMNYCRNFIAKCQIDPFLFFQQSMLHNPSPFACFAKVHGKYIVGNSMERYLCKSGSRIISQPIKGTLANSQDNSEQERKTLYESEKDRSENLMIVDLTRNDLSKSALVRSVQVDELFGIYSFPTVHQMISTVSATIPEDVTFSKLLRDTFPMGSMTGAPKLRSMELIEDFENFRRGVYSGAIGYRRPNGDFDFNVVIRTVLYDPEERCVNVPVGSAITYDSIPEQELHECQVKVKKLQDLLSSCIVD